MPTYEYQCEQCGKRFETFQGMNEEAVKTCPQCGGPVRRLIGTGAGVIFKGRGFNITDGGRQGSHRPSCGRDTPCCGRDVPCDAPPCKD